VSTVETQSQRPSTSREYDGPIVDTDVHHSWRSQEEILAYLPARWRDELRGHPELTQLLNPAITSYPPPMGTNKRLDAYPTDGAPPGSVYSVMKEQLLDPFNVQAAILSYDVGMNPGVPNPYLARDLTRAMNQWSTERWLEGVDDRLYGAVLAPTQHPQEAAEEIRRAGAHDRMAEVLLVPNGLGLPFGHPVYHPMYEAAVEMGLPIAIHSGGDQAKLGTHMTAAGNPGNRLEFHCLAPQSTIHQLVSFITHGVFEKFPTLRLLIIETGVAWVPWLFWRLDALFDDLRAESPWVRRPPSEYFRQHVKLSTQPLEYSQRPGDLVELLEAFGGLDDVLAFGTDYPHWDTDDPLFVGRRIPREWWLKVFHGNARSTLRLAPAAGARQPVRV
jgi:hypothetical protein